MITILLRLAIPISASHLANMTMQVVDTAFVGKLGPAAIGGVSIGNAVFMIFMILGVGMLLGLDFKVSHAFGAKKITECHDYLTQAVIMATVMGTISTLIMYYGAGLLQYSGVPADVALEAQRYLKTLSFSILPFLLFTALRQYLQAFGIAAPVLWFLLIANIINAVCNWIFDFGNLGFPRLEVAGAGIATTVSRLFQVTALSIYVYLWDKKNQYGLLQSPKKFHPELLKQLVRIGAPITGQLMFEVGVFCAATFVAGRLGTIPLAAHQIVLQIASLTFMIPMGIGAAAAVKVGHYLGEKHPLKAKQAGSTAIVLGGVIMLIFGVSMFVFSGKILGWFTTDIHVIQTGAWLLLVAAFFQVFDGVQVVSSGALRGTGNTRASMYANLIGHWILGMPVGILFCFILNLGVYGIWIGLSLGLVFVASRLVWVWRRELQVQK